MPKTTPREEAALKSMDKNGNGPRYVSCDLSTAQKRELDAFIESSELGDLHQWAMQQVMANHTLSIRSLDVGYQCSLTGTKGHQTHENVCLISRSSTPERAMWSVMFKDTVVLHGAWPVTNRMEDLD
jgi:hypothetical protein